MLSRKQEILRRELMLSVEQPARHRAVVRFAISRSSTLHGIIRSDGRQTEAFTVAHNDTFQMDGQTVSRVALKVPPETIDELLRYTNTPINEISCIIPHQPAITLLRKIFDRCGIEFDLVKTNMQNYANTAGATIPLLLDEVCRDGNVKENEKILFVAIGSGMTWGAALYTWH